MLKGFVLRYAQRAVSSGKCDYDHKYSLFHILFLVFVTKSALLYLSICYIKNMCMYVCCLGILLDESFLYKSLFLLLTL